MQRFMTFDQERQTLLQKVLNFLSFAKMILYNDDVSRIWSIDTLILVLNNLEYVDEH